MTALVDWLGGGTALVLGWTVVHSLWQTALVAGVLVLVLRIVPPAMTRIRTATASGALAIVLVLAVAVGLGLAADWRQHTVCWESVDYALEQPSTCASHGVSPPADVVVHKSSGARAVMPWAWISPSSGPLADPAETAALTVTPITPYIATAGSVLVVLALLRLLLDVYLLRRIVCRSETVVDDEILALLERLRNRLGLSSDLDLRVTDDVATPAVAGFRSPTILLPREVSRSLAPLELEWVLAHELVHVKRRHFTVNLAQRTLECLFVWNPFVYWISRQLSEEREALCDAAVVDSPSASRRRYAETLLRLEHLRTPAGAASIGLLGEGPLLRRVRRLTETAELPRMARARRASIAGMLALTGMLLAVQLTARSMAASSWASMEHDIAIREQTADPGGSN